MEKKYELTNETINYFERTLYRIKAVRNFSNVKAGDLGGFVEKEDNLSHKGDCWVYNNARVCNNAKVSKNARVCDDAIISGNAIISDNALVSDYSVIYDNAIIIDNAKTYDYTRVSHNAEISENAKICGLCWVTDSIHVSGNAVIKDNVFVSGRGEICGNAIISDYSDYIIFKNWWSSGRFFTWTKSNNRWKVGCFYGTGEELIKKAYKDSEISGREYERIVRYVESILANEKNQRKQ